MDASVQVVENAAEPLHGTWEVIPDLTIGLQDGVVLQQPIDVAVGREGEIFVLDRLAPDVKVFDATGRPIRTFGRAGSGPGELSREVARVLVVGRDLLAVVDYGNSRLQYFERQGSGTTSERLDLAAGLPLGWDVHPEGYLTAAVRKNSLFAPQGSNTATVEFRAYSQNGEDTLFSLDLVGPGAGREEAALLSPTPVFAVTSSGDVVLGDGSDFRVAVVTTSGELLHTFVRPYEERRVSDSEKDRLVEHFQRYLISSGLPPAAARLATRGGVRVADVYPAFVRVLTDGRGWVWLQHPASVDELLASGQVEITTGTIGGPKWDIFDAKGRYAATLSLPKGFRLTEVADNMLYGHATSESGIPIIQRLRLVRSGRATE